MIPAKIPWPKNHHGKRAILTQSLNPENWAMLHNDFVTLPMGQTGFVHTLPDGEWGGKTFFVPDGWLEGTALASVASLPGFLQDGRHTTDLKRPKWDGLVNVYAVLPYQVIMPSLRHYPNP